MVTKRADLMRTVQSMTGDEKHLAAATSTLDILWTLYSQVLRVDPAMATDRDRFFLSKGHGPMAYYAVLAAKGFFMPEALQGFGSYRSPFGHHPDRLLVKGVEASSGSLGHGLPLAVGTALALRARGETDPAIWVLVGDGELDEGSNHEAIAFAGRLGLDRLHVVVVDNASATHGWPGGIDSRFAREGWSTQRVDGHDASSLQRSFTEPHPGRPLAVIAETCPEGRHDHT